MEVTKLKGPKIRNDYGRPAAEAGTGFNFCLLFNARGIFIYSVPPVG